MELLLNPNSECQMPVYRAKLTFVDELKALIACERLEDREKFLSVFIARWVEEVRADIQLGYLGAGADKARDDTAKKLAEAVFSRVSMRVENHYNGSSELHARILLLRNDPVTYMSPEQESRLIERLQTEHFMSHDEQRTLENARAKKRIVEL
jgi:hypothetical protein